MPLRDTLQLIQDSLVSSTKVGRDCAEIGGYLAMIHPKDPLVWLNYAVPISEPNAEDTTELESHFRGLGRTPRLEFFTDLWPTVEPFLLERGFVCEKRMPVMLLNLLDRKSRVGVHFAREASLDDLAEARYVSNVAFGMPELDPKPDEQAQAALESGRHLASVVEIDGRIVGSGFAVGTTSVREIAGIGTLPEFRRQGIATAVIEELLDRFFRDGGEIAWLTPGDEGAQSLYQGLGFQPIAEQVCYSIPS
ncbi:MAG: GNAT family N-acetyltransferase [Fimbriimonadaceae bacterium]|nr:GNAT family N-acetyltransferase [Fimbriimonadaceae bacterium]